MIRLLMVLFVLLGSVEVFAQEGSQVGSIPTFQMMEDAPWNEEQIERFQQIVQDSEVVHIQALEDPNQRADAFFEWATKVYGEGDFFLAARLYELALQGLLVNGKATTENARVASLNLAKARARMGRCGESHQALIQALELALGEERTMLLASWATSQKRFKLCEKPEQEHLVARFTDDGMAIMGPEAEGWTLVQPAPDTASLNYTPSIVLLGAGGALCLGTFVWDLVLATQIESFNGLPAAARGPEDLAAFQSEVEWQRWGVVGGYAGGLLSLGLGLLLFPWQTEGPVTISPHTTGDQHLLLFQVATP